MSVWKSYKRIFVKDKILSQNVRPTSANKEEIQSSDHRLSTEEISQKAYELYLQQGCPEGRAIDHWLEAEASIGIQTNAIP